MPDEKRVSTDELLRLLFKERSLEHFLQRNESAYLNTSFSDYLSAWCRKHGEVPEQLIRRTNLEKSYGHQLFSGRRTPSRDTALQLAFGFSLSVTETQELLKVARKSPLYPRVKRDSAIAYCLYHGKSFVDTQIILQDLGLPILGGGGRND